jgi:hypothetical protein
MHLDLRFLLFVTPNILIVGTLIGWLFSIVDTIRKKRVPKMYWLVQGTLTVLLPQLRVWPNRPLMSYLPNPLFPFLDRFMLFPYLHVAFTFCLPSSRWPRSSLLDVYQRICCWPPEQPTSCLFS